MARLDDERCWGNPMSDAESDEVPADALRQLLTRAVAYVEEKVTRRLDAATASHASVYAGRGGIALFFLRLAQLSSERGQAAAATTLLQRADAELDAAQAARHGTHGPTFLEGSAGLDALRAAVATAAGRHAEAALAAARVVAAEHDVARLPKVDCELLYGRAGYLHACLVARTASGGSAAALDAVIVRTVEAIVAAGTASADEQGPAVAEHWGLLYTWHDAEYLGAAHGLAGIVATVLQAEAALAHTGWRLPAASAARLRTATLALAAALLPSGNLPTRARGHVADDRLVQWCHGAPGLLMLAPQAVGAYHRGSAAGVPLAAIAVPLAAAADCVWCDAALLHAILPLSRCPVQSC